MDDYIKKYFERLDKIARDAYNYANEAKKGSFDPEEHVEISLAKDLADRVEGLLGIQGLKETLRELEKTGMSREKLAFEITRRIARGDLLNIQDLEKRIDVAVRVGTAILTEGVLVAPTEGISKVVVKKDKQPYVSIYYAGPIRSAGGTVAAVTALLADLARRENNIPPYKATREEVLRIVEEANLYDAREARLQYKPPDEDIETIFSNIPVELNGEPTSQNEVMATRDLPRIETNRIRGGVPLVLCEGIAQKAKKLKKYVKELGIDGWDFLWNLKGIKQEVGDKGAVDAAYLDGLVAGRPVISYPGAKGGFRLRYGRSMTNGLMAKNIHPTSMYLLDNFIANGTHVKIEKPGKGAIITSNDALHPPVVRLKDGTVVYNPDKEQLKQVEKVLFLGDMLSTYGDFLKSNNALVPSPYVEEWWRLESNSKDPETLEEAIKISKEKNVPLYPKYVYFWKNISIEQLLELVSYLEKGTIEDFILISKEAKPILEEILVPHKVEGDYLKIEGEWAKALLVNLGYDGTFDKVKQSKETDILKRLSEASGFEIRDKVGVFIGMRMGRPEKAKPRVLDGSPNVLFPVGSSVRDIFKHKEVNVEISTFVCENCGKLTVYPKCEDCGSRTSYQGSQTKILNMMEILQDLKNKYGTVSEFKGVKGLISSEKIPEFIEKGYIRAKYELPVNKDGTMRFDAINITLTHFRPKDINVSVEKLKELGYSVDYEGKPLENEEQIVPLYPQDIVIPESALEYLYKAAKAIDDMLVNVYGKDPYYNLKSKEDVIGQLVITQSPHTSAGIVARVIGYTDIKGIFGHPFLHTAKRRNVDGDEDSIFLLMDGFLNFSKHYLGSSRGGTMDAPIVLIININPKEVDDEVYTMEVEPYNLEFYKATLEQKMPGEVKIDVVGNHLEDFPYFLFNLTHPQSSILLGPKETTYVKLKSMVEKVEKEAEMMAKLKSVDVRDVITRIIQDHFIPDIYGNLRKFSKQEFRCKKCNAKYRRVPLIGKCVKCGGDLLLTIHKGGIEKYLDIALELTEKYNLPKYIKSRLELVKIELKNMFGEDKQKGLQDFM